MVECASLHVSEGKVSMFFGIKAISSLFFMIMSKKKREGRLWAPRDGL